ncbi:Small glutamine-rich tetratricopeptide repeat-containing protein alpha, partial [Nosema bombycis CQ1]
MKYEDILKFIERKKSFINDNDKEKLNEILENMNIREKKELNSIKEKGDLEFRKGNYQKAVEIYTSYLDLNDENYIIYSNRAATNYKLKNNEKVIEDCMKGLRLCPTFYKFYLRLGVLYLEQWFPTFLEDDLEKAIEYFKKGLEVDPGNNVLKQQLLLAEEMNKEKTEDDQKEKVQD